MKMKKTTVLTGLVLVALSGVTYLPYSMAETPQSTNVPIQKTKPFRKQQERPVVEVVFVLDTTGSMGGMIQAAKEKIWSIATTLSSTQPAPRIKIGLVAYRDTGDDYVTQVTDLSDDLDNVFAQLMAFQAHGGGDTPESVNKALSDAVSNISWSNNKHAYQTIFLVGDAPGHIGLEQDVPYTRSVALARTKNIIVNTIQCGDHALTAIQWKDIAQNGGGEYLNVEQEGSALASTTPFDEQITGLSRELESTRIYYGTKKQRDSSEKRKEKTAELYASAPASSLAKRAQYNVSESGSSNLLGENELLDDIAHGRVNIEEVDKTMLPESIAKMDQAEKKQYVKKHIVKREKLVKEIETLTQKRQAYLTDKLSETSGTASSLDYQLFDTLRKQAGEKGIIYEASDLSL